MSVLLLRAPYLIIILYALLYKCPSYYCGHLILLLSCTLSCINVRPTIAGTLSYYYLVRSLVYVSVLLLRAPYLIIILHALLYMGPSYYCGHLILLLSCTLSCIWVRPTIACVADVRGGNRRNNFSTVRSFINIRVSGLSHITSTAQEGI